MKYLFDTDCLIDAIVGRSRARDLVGLLSDDGLAVSIITVAATAVDSSLTLVTRNTRHFSRVPALSIYPL